MLLLAFDPNSKQLSDADLPPRMGVRIRPLIRGFEKMQIAAIRDEFIGLGSCVDPVGVHITCQ